MKISNQNKLVTVAEMQTLEQAADAAGHGYATMMEVAGRGVADCILTTFGKTRSVLVLVGPGNNGGDGLVCARYLRQAGATVRVYLWKRRTDPADDYEGHYQKLLALDVPTAHADVDENFAILRTWLETMPDAIVVDALLGTGTNRSIAGQLATLLNLVRSHQVQSVHSVVAVDCPSGLNCDTGTVDSHTLVADQTVTFAYAKVGHYQFPGAAICGAIHVVDIGIDPALADDIQTFVLDAATIRDWLPKRSNNSHKGSFGKVMAAVGSHTYPGAAFLSCSAAGRVGAGLVTGAVTEKVWSVVAGKLPEPTWVPLPMGSGDAEGMIAEEAAPLLLDAIKGYHALAFGCGLNQKPTTMRFVRRLLNHADQLPATLIDADGLNILAQLENWPRLLPKQVILTPHAAELGRLCGLSVEKVLPQRWALAREKARAWNAVILAKGPYTVIAHPDGRLAILPIATPALATAGTGDVLSGTIAGLLAQGLEPFAAASVGAWLHGQAGLRCAVEIGMAGVVASDLLPRLPQVIRELL